MENVIARLHLPAVVSFNVNVYGDVLVIDCF